MALPFLAKLLLPIAVDTVVSYIKSSETDKDDKVLKVVQEGAKYLAPKQNNSVSQNVAQSLSTDVMTDNRFYQKAKE